MTSPTGDLPDFDTLTSPMFKAAAILDTGTAGTQTLVLSGNPTRLWQAWMSIAFESTGAFTGAGSIVAPNIQDGNGKVYLATQAVVNKANDHDSASVTIPLYGVPVPLIGGTYGLFLVLAAGRPNTIVHVSCGIIYSQP